jgi:DNA topoisomerase VI subunit B
LSNAIKYSEKGRIKLSINLLQQFYCIKVEDEGIGISAENIDKIFDEFTQLDGSYTRKFGGTGLGLSITKEFVKMLGGRIEVKSTLGTGSCFTVILPVNGSNAKNHRNEFDIEKRTDGICKNEVIYVDTDENFTEVLNDHIPKPIDEDYFEEVLKRWLGDKL